MKNTFRKTDKILKTTQFKQIKKMGRKKFTSHLIFLELTNNNCPRLGLIARKSIGNSVQRNYLKRIVREYFRCNKNFINRSDYIIIFRSHTSDKPTILSELNYLFKRES